jgi:type I restriction enzyme R subunit
MLLTGFDAPKLNTLYVDKNLKYHGLIQAFSRTNRLLNAYKPHGNIVIFRNLKKNVDDALRLYGDPEANEVVFKKPYEVQVAEFNAVVEKLRELVPEVESVDLLKSEEEKALFVKIFRELLRHKASLETFAEFSFDDLRIFVQEFENYKGKYYEIYETNKKNIEKEKESVLGEIDFELELVVSDEINYDYIIGLLQKVKDGGQKEVERALRQIQNNLRLKSKRELIEKFIKEQLPKLPNGANVKVAFEEFWEDEKEKYLENVAKENPYLGKDGLQGILSEYYQTDRLPRDERILQYVAADKRPGILEQGSVVKSIKSYIYTFVDIFE